MFVIVLLFEIIGDTIYRFDDYFPTHMISTLALLFWSIIFSMFCFGYGCGIFMGRFLDTFLPYDYNKVDKKFMLILYDSEKVFVM